MASVVELSNTVFLAALVIVLLDSTTIGGILLQCIVVSDAKVILEGRSKLFTEAGGNRESLRPCECGEHVRNTLEIIEARLISLGDPARKLEALKFRVDRRETSWNDVEVLKNTVDKLERSWNDVEVLKTDITSIQKDIQMLKQGLNEEVLPSPPRPSLDEVIKMLRAEEDNIRRLKTEVAKIKSDRGDLRESFERIKREVAKERSETNLTVASIRARIESMDKTGQRVIGILRASKSFSDNFTIDEKDVAEAPEASTSVSQRMNDEIEDESTKFMNDSARVPLEKFRENISQTNATAEYVAGSATETGASTAHNTSKVLSGSEESQRLSGEDVKEIQFVECEGGFSFMPSGKEVAASTKFQFTNDPLSPVVPAACSSFPNRTEHTSVRSSESVTLTTQDFPDREWPLERAISLLAAQFMDLQKSMAASRLDDDSKGCPGLKLLATDEHVVLSTEFGRFRAPNLPTDLLPTGSVVRFRCAPAGSHRLVGAAELRCLGRGRWSHRPPVCQPLPTLEQLQKADKTNEIVPSIHYAPVHEDNEWIYTDDDGNFVVHPGNLMRLTCLYPRFREDVVWLHNGRGVPQDVILSRVRKANLGFAYEMWIMTATPKHSGEYSCQVPDGKRHSVKIKVAEVECERLTAPLNGLVDIRTWGRVLVGIRANFSCHLGHQLVGRQEIVCLGNGRWSDLVPTCEEIENFVPTESACRRPSVPPGMVVRPDQKWYDSDSKVNYSCDGGRQLVGNSTAACDNGAWRGKIGNCE